MRHKIYISDYHCITPIGMGAELNWKLIRDGRSALELSINPYIEKPFFTAVIDAQGQGFNFDKDKYTRLEALMIQCLIPLVNRKPVSPKSLLILSTTKGNISLLKNETEPPHGVFLMESAKKIARYFGFKLHRR